VIKIIYDNLAAINSLVPNHNLVHYTFLGWPHEHDPLATSLSCELMFDDLRAKSVLHA